MLSRRAARTMAYCVDPEIIPISQLSFVDTVVMGRPMVAENSATVMGWKALNARCHGVRAGLAACCLIARIFCGLGLVASAYIDRR